MPWPTSGAADVDDRFREVDFDPHLGADHPKGVLVRRGADAAFFGDQRDAVLGPSRSTSKIRCFAFLVGDRLAVLFPRLLPSWVYQRSTGRNARGAEFFQIVGEFDFLAVDEFQLARRGAELRIVAGVGIVGRGCRPGGVGRGRVWA